MVPIVPLRFGGFLLFRLFGLLFAAIGALNLLRPRAMTAYRVRRRHDDVDGTIEPTKTRLLFTRAVGGLGVVFGLGLFLGVLGP